jgi:hypothetical protein
MASPISSHSFDRRSAAHAGKIMPDATLLWMTNLTTPRYDGSAFASLSNCCNTTCLVGEIRVCKRGVRHQVTPE